MNLKPARLTKPQHETVNHYRAYNVKASWFVGEGWGDGSVEVVAIGDTFVWSFLIQADGESSAVEAELGEWSTGVIV